MRGVLGGRPPVCFCAYEDDDIHLFAYPFALNSDFESAVDYAYSSGNQLDVVIRKARWDSTTEYYAKSKSSKKSWWSGDV